MQMITQMREGKAVEVEFACLSLRTCYHHLHWAETPGSSGGGEDLQLGTHDPCGKSSL